MSKATKPVTLTEQGEGLWLKGRYTEATAIFTRVLGIAESPAALALRGDCYRMMKRHSDAMDDLNRALSLVQKKEFYFLRAHLFDDLGKSAEALADLDRALEIDRTFSKAVQFRESLLKRPTYDQAVQIARQMGAREPQTVTERIAAVHGAAKGMQFSQSERAIERETLWVQAIMRGEDPRRTVK